jgi:putative endonuclease
MKEHKCGHLSQAVFRIDRLVYVERYNTASKAEARVKALRAASREWTEALIERRNPNWIDLAAPATTDVKHAA